MRGDFDNSILSVNGTKIAEGHIPKTQPFAFSADEGADVGLKAEALRDGDAMKVFIELRDVNYPGSTYTLTYDPASDLLKGIYDQAAEKQRFPVVFVRMQ